MYGVIEMFLFHQFNLNVIFLTVWYNFPSLPLFTPELNWAVYSALCLYNIWQKNLQKHWLFFIFILFYPNSSHACTVLCQFVVFFFFFFSRNVSLRTWESSRASSRKSRSLPGRTWFWAAQPRAWCREPSSRACRTRAGASSLTRWVRHRVGRWSHDKRPSRVAKEVSAISVCGLKSDAAPVWGSCTGREMEEVNKHPGLLPFGRFVVRFRKDRPLNFVRLRLFSWDYSLLHKKELLRVWEFITCVWFGGV